MLDVEALVLLRVLGIPLALGAVLVRVLGISFATDRLAFLGWAWVGGTVATALVEFAWLWVGLPSALALDAALLGLAAVLLVIARRVRPLGPEVLQPAPAWERLFFATTTALVVLVTVVRISVGTNEIIFRSDEAGFWAFHAKVIFECGGFGPAYREMSQSFLLRHPDYPLLNPLLQVWTFLHFDRITHVANRLPIQLFSLALVLVMAAALRRVTRPAIAAAFLLVLLSCGYTYSWTQRAHSDVMVALGTVLLLDVYLRWRSGPSVAWVRLASLGGAFLLWSKHEGKLVVIAILLAVVITRLPALRLSAGQRAGTLRGLRPRRAHLALLAPLAILFLSSAFNSTFGYANDVLSGADQPGGRGVLGRLVDDGFARIPIVVPHFLGSSFLRPSHSSYLQLAFLAVLLLLPLAVWRSGLRLPGLAILALLAGVVAVFLGTPRELDWHLRTAADRVMFQSAAATFLWLAAATRELFGDVSGQARVPGGGPVLQEPPP